MKKLIITLMAVPSLTIAANAGGWWNYDDRYNLGFNYSWYTWEKGVTYTGIVCQYGFIYMTTFRDGTQWLWDDVTLLHLNENRAKQLGPMYKRPFAVGSELIKTAPKSGYDGATPAGYEGAIPDSNSDEIIIPVKPKPQAEETASTYKDPVSLTYRMPGFYGWAYCGYERWAASGIGTMHYLMWWYGSDGTRYESSYSHSGVWYRNLYPDGTLDLYTTEIPALQDRYPNGYYVHWSGHFIGPVGFKGPL
jgi:hypothetical protein